jgi:hypothetical protein
VAAFFYGFAPQGRRISSLAEPRRSSTPRKSRDGGFRDIQVLSVPHPRIREGRKVQDIRIIGRNNHSIADEIKGAIELLKGNGITAQAGENKDGYGVIQIDDTAERTNVLALLKADGFIAVLYEAHASYEKS